MEEQKGLGQKESGERDREQKEIAQNEFSQQDFCVDGYRFGSVDDAKEAQVEKIKMDYFTNKLQGRNMESMLAVYDKVLDERIFETPIGWEYLKRMQRELRRGGIAEERIRPIPMYVTFSHKDDAAAAAPVRERIRPSRKKSDDKKKLQISVMVNILLVILVLSMFYITLNSKNPNIINYKNAILNEYASWEQELTDRENEIREKEKALGIE